MPFPLPKPIQLMHALIVTRYTIFALATLVMAIAFACAALGDDPGKAWPTFRIAVITAGGGALLTSLAVAYYTHGPYYSE